MCQQTQVATVIPYWERWMKRFPMVSSLAQAPEQEVLQYWAGLGYYQRARSLHAAAIRIAEVGFPTSYAEWLQVPGVGGYTAGAIASICLNQPTPAVDGNVRRVYARLNAQSRASGVRLWAAGVMDVLCPGTWNQALMELGARVCKPRNPDCANCPVEKYCSGKSSPEKYPAPTPKRASILVERYVALCRREGAWAMRQAQPGEWGEGLWEFPSKESPWDGEVVGVVRHTITHHRITLKVQMADVDTRVWQSTMDIPHLPMGSAHRRIAQNFLGE